MLESYYTNPGQWLNYSHDRTVPSENIQFHLHNYYEIYFFISGNVNYFIEKQVYSLNYGDLLLINHLEIHKPTFQSRQAYERIVIHFEPQLARIFSPPELNLLQPFLDRPRGEKNKMNLTSSEIDELLGLFKKMEDYAEDPFPGSNTLRLSCFIEILVFLNKVFLNIKPATEHSNVPEALIPVLDFIDGHLDEDLTLTSLGSRFFMNPSYLSRLFKQGTGSNIHEFIIYKRISKAKNLLREGCSVTEACTRCGFNDYANFLRMFKRKVGLSPGKYRHGSE